MKTHRDHCQPLNRMRLTHALTHTYICMSFNKFIHSLCTSDSQEPRRESRLAFSTRAHTALRGPRLLSDIPVESRLVNLLNVGLPCLDLDMYRWPIENWALPCTRMCHYVRLCACASNSERARPREEWLDGLWVSDPDPS